MRLRDTARWDSVTIESTNVGARTEGRNMHRVNGYYYCNAAEARLAELLRRLKIDFTPDVKMLIDLPSGKKRKFVPDFIFNTWPYVWTKPGTTKKVVIHGIEAKKRPHGVFSEKAKETVDLLYRQQGIYVLLLSDRTIFKFHSQGYLPMKPFTGTA